MIQFTTFDFKIFQQKHFKKNIGKESFEMISEISLADSKFQKLEDRYRESLSKLNSTVTKDRGNLNLIPKTLKRRKKLKIKKGSRLQ